VHAAQTCRLVIPRIGKHKYTGLNEDRVQAAIEDAWRFWPRIRRNGMPNAEAADDPPVLPE